MASPTTNPPDRTDPPRGNAHIVWPGAVVALLALNVGICGITVYAALRNPVAVEPDYYDKALNWDEHRSDVTLDELGLVATADVHGGVLLLTLSPSRSSAAEAASLPSSAEVELFHRAMSSERMHLTLTQDEEGRLATSPTWTRPGVYEARFTIKTADGVVRFKRPVEWAGGG